MATPNPEEDTHATGVTEPLFVAATETPKDRHSGKATEVTPSPKKSRPQVERPISVLPSAEEIHAAIPEQGIGSRVIAFKFMSYLDETNTELFFKLLKAVSFRESETRIRPVPRLPSSEELEAILSSTLPEAPAAKEEKCRFKRTSRHISGMTITFSKEDETIRGRTKIKPPKFFRVFHEYSATLSCYVTPDTLVRHRDKPDLRLDDDNAFQSIGGFIPSEDLKSERIERHLEWQRKVDPTSYVSAFNNLNDAIRRADFHYRKSRRCSERVSIAAISAEGLVAASCRFTIEETVDRFQGRNLKETTVTTRDVVVPAWIDRSAIPSDRISITGTELLDFRADMWLSVTELRRSSLGIYCAKGHGYEWLACGAIPKSRIVKIMPYDGEGLHQFRATWIVHSTRSVLDWVFDWSTNMWKIDHEMAKLARLQKKISDMRKRKVGPEILEERPKKRRKSKANAKRTANAAKNAGRVEDNDIDSRSEAVTKTKSRKTIADESMLVSALLLA